MRAAPSCFASGGQTGRTAPGHSNERSDKDSLVRQSNAVTDTKVYGLSSGHLDVFSLVFYKVFNCLVGHRLPYFCPFCSCTLSIDCSAVMAPSMTVACSPLTTIKSGLQTDIAKDIPGSSVSIPPFKRSSLAVCFTTRL